MAVTTALLLILFIPIIYNALYPLKPPKLDHYFQAGMSVYSKWEGLTQTVIKQVDNKVYSELRLDPGAAGPPEHLHTGFDEWFVVEKGTLTVKVNGQTSQAVAGDRIFFPKGQYHCFCNQTEEEVIIKCDSEEAYLPATFAYTLFMFYPVMDSTSSLKPLHIFLKMSVFGDIFDSYVKEAPVQMQRAIKKILQPYARILGYKLYDERSKP